MNVYDFDKTIYEGDSTLDFYRFCLGKQPTLLLCLPSQIAGYLWYIVGRFDKDQFKESFFCFLKKLPGTISRDQLLVEFWDKHAAKIQPWYLAQQKTDDVIISASPEFLLLPICRRLQIQHLIATKVDEYSGRFNGANCYGAAKVERLQEYLRQAGTEPQPNDIADMQADSAPNVSVHTNFDNQTSSDKHYPASLQIDAFYSDSLSDAPLAALAKHSYIVTRGHFTDWAQYQPSHRQKLWEMFFTRSFVLFVLIGIVNAVNGILFAYLYSLLFPTNLGFILGYLTSLTISYFLNSKITFAAKLGWQKYLKFCIAYIPNFLAQNATVMLFYNILGWPKLLTFALAAIFGVPITFALMKLYAFKL